MNIFEKTYLKIILESTDNIVISKIEIDELKEALLNNLNQKLNTRNITKYFADNVECYALKNNNVIKAICIVSIKNNICFIKELTCLESGHEYSKQLLKYMLNQPFKLIYLCADWTSSDKLIAFYKNQIFNLTEYVSRSGIHWFYKNRMMTKDNMNNFKNKYYF